MSIPLWIGTLANAGIFRVSFDRTHGVVGTTCVVASVSDPSFLLRRGACLYAVASDARVLSYRLTAEGDLTPSGSVPSGGRGPCHLAISPDGSRLAVANYAGGNVGIITLNSTGAVAHLDLTLQPSGKGPHPTRQTQSHPHGVYFTGNDELRVPDLGTDRVHTFERTAGSWRPDTARELILNAGAGPRHLAGSRDGAFLYVINELTNTISVVESRRLELRQEVALLPATFTTLNTAAEIALTADERYVVASNRGHDSLVFFARDPREGTLGDPNWIPCGGFGPRHFALLDHWLLVANQFSDEIAVFALDLASGRPSAELISTARVPSPSCVCL